MNHIDVKITPDHGLINRVIELETSADHLFMEVIPDGKIQDIISTRLSDQACRMIAEVMIEYLFEREDGKIIELASSLLGGNAENVNKTLHRLFLESLTQHQGDQPCRSRPSLSTPSPVKNSTSVDA